ncbi:hypothetical protein MWU59_13675 [Flavobacteriaceae bacterium F08102]|nr:hypothetical protein [Flavobacteriaceae bacterium F08102]
MSSIKNLKKDINYQLSDIIEECYVWQMLQDDKEKANSAEKIIDKCIKTFDELIAQVNAKNIENKKAHFKAIREALNKKSEALIGEIEKL